MANSSFRRLNNAVRRQQDEESVLIKRTANNDYGYIPPGYGLNGNLKTAMSALAGPCACHNPGVSLPIEQHQTSDDDPYETNQLRHESNRAGYSILCEDQPLPPNKPPKTKQENFALKIDRCKSYLSSSVDVAFRLVYFLSCPVRAVQRFLLVSLLSG